MNKAFVFLVVNYFFVLVDTFVLKVDEYSILSFYYFFYPFVLLGGLLCELWFIQKRRWFYAVINGLLGVGTALLANYIT